MKSPYESRRDHALRGPLEATVSSVVADNELVKRIVSEVLMSLDEQNIISYMPRSTINLLTPFGRTIVLLSERPNLTLREMSVFLGVTEASMHKSVTKLMEDKLVNKRKNNGRYEYSLNADAVAGHSDVRRLFALILRETAEK